MIIPNSKKAQIAVQITERLREKGHVALFAGGCVRDFLMDKVPLDYDIATTARPEEVEKIFTKTIPVGKQFGVMIVLEESESFEVATFRKEGGYHDGRHPSFVEFTIPEVDARRRDFTVNGIFYDPAQDKVYDFVNGASDIKAGIIRAIGNPFERFEEDKLRLLRAIRFASTLQFQIESATWEAVKKMAPQILQVSPERIRDEIIKILTRPGAARGYSLLAESGLMAVILPEVEALKGIQQSPDFHPEGDVFVHTGLLLEKLEHPSKVLALSALFHDVGKPKTYAVRSGKITFYEHAPIGARMTKDIMKRLRFSNEEIEAVSECVANHMKFADVQKMRSGKLKQFVSRPTFETEMELHRIDCQSSHGKLDNYYFLKTKLQEYSVEDLKPNPLVNGHDLIAAGFLPGPALKQILAELFTLQLEGAVTTKEEAVNYAIKNFSHFKKT